MCTTIYILEALLERKEQKQRNLSPTVTPRRMRIEDWEEWKHWREKKREEVGAEKQSQESWKLWPQEYLRLKKTSFLFYLSALGFTAHSSLTHLSGW